MDYLNCQQNFGVEMFNPDNVSDSDRLMIRSFKICWLFDNEGQGGHIFIMHNRLFMINWEVVIMELKNSY